MTVLNPTLNTIDREERNKINENWQRISLRFSQLQAQISIISGESDVEKILEDLTSAIDNANTTISNLSETGNATINEVNSKISEINGKLNETQIAIDNSNLATNGANTAISDLRAAIQEFEIFYNNLNFRGLYSPTETYEKLNIVRYNKSSFASLKTNVGVTPVDNGVDWVLVAEGGLDGQGAVNSVNEVLPSNDGNVNLTSSDIGAASLTDIASTNNNLNSLTDSFNSYLTAISGRTNITKANMQVISPGTNIITFDSISNSNGANFVSLSNGRVLVSQKGMYLVLCNINKSSAAVENVEINLNGQSLSTLKSDFTGSYHFSSVINGEVGGYLDVNVYNPNNAVFDISQYATNLTIVRLS